jgi:hypothetical protein
MIIELGGLSVEEYTDALGAPLARYVSADYTREYGQAAAAGCSEGDASLHAHLRVELPPLCQSCGGTGVSGPGLPCPRCQGDGRAPRTEWPEICGAPHQALGPGVLTLTPAPQGDSLKSSRKGGGN